MNEINLALKRHEKRKEREKGKEENKRISHIFSKILISLILLLSCTIYGKLSPENQKKLKENIFENNLAFTKINEWYRKSFGQILPSMKEPTTSLVSASSLDEKTSYLDGYKIKTTKSSAISNISGGLLVFLGEKEGYGNTLIIQGVDGVDIWYGNINDTTYKLYDYIDAGAILGTAQEDYYELVFQKDGSFLTYEEYFGQVRT